MVKKHNYVQTKNGRTYSYYRKSLTINGKTRTITAANAKEWTEKAEAAKKEAKDNYGVAEKNLTVKQLAEVFKKDGENYAPKTYQEREYVLRLYIVPELGHIKVNGLKNIHIRRSEEHTSELQSQAYLVCRLLLEKKNIPLPKKIGNLQRSPCN